MPNSAFIPAEDSAKLSRLTSATTLAAADLMKMMVDILPKDRRDRFLRILDEGGRVGIECTIDKTSSRKIVLTAIERGGERFAAAEVFFVGDRPKNGDPVDT